MTIYPNPWEFSNSDENNLSFIKELHTQVHEIEKFQNAVFDALSSNNKTKLRVLNSSINPKMIIRAPITSIIVK